MLATVRLLGIPITCYPAFIIGLCLVTKIIRIFLNKYSKKQSEEKAVRDEKIAQLQKEAGGDRNVLSDKIYEYYKESNYNPYLTFLSKVALIIIDFDTGFVADDTFLCTKLLALPIIICYASATTQLASPNPCT